MMGLNETNINQREGYFQMRRLRGYNIFASNKDNKKHKESGVVLIVKDKWYKKMGSWKSNSPYNLTWRSILTIVSLEFG